MCTTRLQPTEPLWAEPESSTRDHAHHDAVGLRATLPGDRRALYGRAHARLDGHVLPVVGADAGAGALTWRGAACIRGRGVPMAAISGRLAAAQLLETPSIGRSRRGATSGGTSTRSATTARGSDDHRAAGSVFSPYYAFTDSCSAAEPRRAQRRDRRPRWKKRWAMTERGKNDVERSAHALRIGPSASAWSGGCLEVQIAELGCPIRADPRAPPADAPRRDPAPGRAGRRSRVVARGAARARGARARGAARLLVGSRVP
jgi:hypothetical protein